MSRTSIPVGSILPGAVFRITRELASVPHDLKLRHAQWGVLFSVTGEHTVAQIGSHLCLDRRERDEAFAILQQGGLIEEVAVSYGEYLRALSTLRDERPVTLAQFLEPGATFGPRHGRPNPVVESEQRATPPEATQPNELKSQAPPSPETQAQQSATTVAESKITPDNSTAGTAGSATRVNRPSRPSTHQGAAVASALSVTSIEDSTSLEDSGIHRTRAVPVARPRPVTFEPLPGPPPPDSTAQDSGATAIHTVSKPAPATQRKRLSIAALMRFLFGRTDDRNVGQLDLYRVFIRIDTQLLKRNGITTLRFRDEHLIDDPELQQALRRSIKKTLGIECPASVFVD